jgi:glucose-6-phosphate isomerase
MGQYVQQGRRDLFETVLTFADTAAIPFPPDSGIADGLDRLTGRSLGEVNAIAKDAVVAAHISGGVPVLEIEAARLDEAGLGALLYFFELSCAYSGILGGVNPFDQPGVEAYKKNMRDKLQNNG